MPSQRRLVRAARGGVCACSCVTYPLAAFTLTLCFRYLISYEYLPRPAPRCCRVHQRARQVVVHLPDGRHAVRRPVADLAREALPQEQEGRVRGLHGVKGWRQQRSRFQQNDGAEQQAAPAASRSDTRRPDAGRDAGSQALAPVNRPVIGITDAGLQAKAVPDCHLITPMHRSKPHPIRQQPLQSRQAPCALALYRAVHAGWHDAPLLLATRGR